MSPDTCARMPKAAKNTKPRARRDVATTAQATTTKRPLVKVSPDPVNPPAFIDFMMKGWRSGGKRPATRVKNAARFAARRAKVAHSFAGEVIIVPTGHEKIRSNDDTYRFRPASDFYYLTGNLEPDCVLVLAPKGARGFESILFVEPNPGRSDPTFFTNRSKGELWVGPRLGVSESAHRFGVDQCLGLPELPGFLAAFKQRKGPPFRVLRGFDALVEGALPAVTEHQKQRDQELASFLSGIRLSKDAAEVAAIEEAAAATAEAFDLVMRALAHASTERELEGVFNACARSAGNDVGFGTIIAAGSNACVLHWTRNDTRLESGDLVLIDAGIEGRELYTADVTRTVPISGKFGREQREVYELVLAAQEAAIAAVRPGVDFVAPHRAAMEVLAHGLERMGILTMGAEVALRPENLFYKRYTLHNTSHMLGLDVHDGAHTRYREGKLSPGMVLTVEPGLYFQLDDLTVPPRYRGIGVRIEDDVLVTSRGYRVLTSVPKSVADIEHRMRELWRAKRATR